MLILMDDHLGPAHGKVKMPYSVEEYRRGARLFFVSH